MKNTIMELADAVVDASHGYGAFRKDEARAALQAEVERVEQALDLLSEGWRVANSDVFHKSIEIVSLRAELEELKLAYAECTRQRNELLVKHKQAAMKGQPK